jgi:signal transduction histidine kinase
LRTPLDAIIANSELLLENADALGQADFIANLNLTHSAGLQLLEIIDDLLDPNKFASGDVVFNLASLIANLRISLYDPDDHEISDDLYGKVVAHLSESPPAFLVHFTSLPPEAETFLAKFLGVFGIGKHKRHLK